MSNVHSTTKPLLVAEGLTKEIEATGRTVLGKKQVIAPFRNVSFVVYESETFGIVGESGSGKTTLLKALSLISAPTSGRVLLGDEVIFDEKTSQKELRGQIQMVFQDPDSSLNPTMKVKDAVAEPLLPLKLSKSQREERVVESLESVGLGNDVLDKRPRQLSGGQKQRVSIARALSPRPKLLLLDEPTSSLDAAVQAQVLNVLIDLQSRFQLTCIFVTHNISVAKYICDRIAVFYAGNITEVGNAEEILSEPLHPYTITLKEAYPTPDPAKRNVLDAKVIGEPPSLLSPPSGCTFHPRCAYAKDICRAEVPELRTVFGNRLVSCHFAEEIAAHKENALGQIMDRESNSVTPLDLQRRS